MRAVGGGADGYCCGSSDGVDRVLSTHYLQEILLEHVSGDVRLDLQ